MHKPRRESALQAIEEALELLRSAPALEGTTKESVEVLLEIAAEKLRTDD